MKSFHFSRQVWTGIGITLFVLLMALLYTYANEERKQTATAWRLEKGTTTTPVSLSLTATTTATESTSSVSDNSEKTIPRITDETKKELPEVSIPVNVPSQKVDSAPEEKDEIAENEVDVTIATPSAQYRFNTNEMLSTHNVVRKSVGVPSLTWSDSISESAQAWSEVLKTEKCAMRHDPDTPYGENIFWSWNSNGKNKDLISTPSDATTWWTSETAFYNYDENTCKKGEQCDHYTQMVWGSTTEVGCGVSTCIRGSEHTDIWVCRYNPPGNNGDRPF